jgi:20S proteasome alpha/beta subunit
VTLVVGCHFSEGAVVLADSRATWQTPGGKNVFEDTLQKILPLLPTATIAYAGDVSTATSLINSLSKRIQKNNRLKNIGHLGPNLGRFAKHDYQTLQGLNRNPQPVSLVLSGIDVGRSKTGAGPHEVGLWAYSSPRFHLTEVKYSFVAIGSGANIAIPFLKKHWSEIVGLAGGLQEKANWLFPRLESELENGTDLFVGGLFQILLIEPAGIRPLNYWRLTLDPDSDVDPISMSMSKGVWTQSNLRSGSNIAVKKPSSLLQGSPRSIEVRTYPGPQRPTRHYPESFLT